jgi:DNA anti-recombination protein RmuC
MLENDIAPTPIISHVPDWLLGLATPNDWLFGIEMPLITFVLSVVIVLGALIVYFIGFLLPWLKLRAELKAAVAFIESKVPEKGTSIDDETYHEIDEYFMSKPDFAYSWREFSEVIIKVDGRFHNSIQAEHFFTHSSVIRTGPTMIGAWHSSIPGILTGLGLLGTFVALLLGLAQLHVSETQQVEGIEEFINALSGKFTSSIAGLVMAILYTSCERISVSNLDKYLYDLQHSINENFKRITPEMLLHYSLNEIKAQRVAMDSLASDMAEQINTGIQQSINPEISKMITAIEHLNQTTEKLKNLNTESLNKTLEALTGIKNQSSDAIVQALHSMMDEFRTTLTGTASNELTELSQSLAKASTFLETMDTKNQQMEGRMDQLLNQLSEGMVNQQSQFGSHAQELAQTMAGLITRMEDSSNQSVDVMQRRIEEMLQKNAGWSAQLQAQMQGMAEAMTQASNQMVAQLKEASSSQTTQMQEAQEALNTKQHQWVQGIQEEMSSLVQNVGTNVLEREAQIQHLMNQTVQSQQQLLAQLTNASVDLRQAFEQYKATLETNKYMLAEAKPIVSQLQGVSGQIGSGLEGITQSNQQMQRTLTENRQFVEDYQRLVNELKGLHDRQKEAYSILDEQLGRILKQINENMIQYNSTTRDGLQMVLGEWDNELRTSVKLLSGPVSELSELFDDLTEMLEKKIVTSLKRPSQDIDTQKN